MAKTDDPVKLRKACDFCGKPVLADEAAFCASCGSVMCRGCGSFGDDVTGDLCPWCEEN